MRLTYINRKNKEFMAMHCGTRCFSRTDPHYLQDSLSAKEKQCLAQCFHKTFCYLTHANTVYSYLTADQDLLEEIRLSHSGDAEAELRRQGVGMDKTVNLLDGNSMQIPSRAEMEQMAAQNR